ncbi:hypothetical protein [Paenibacillus hexagrammi]|uniref:Uncharacterized protein n=1 Tax=Paenibacillus hexagrammi TaxID=2908839 RepID=A0ABY3SSA4_9BACL|nr:hypothetical protein [Paenibacillus sp. YPD9-1]UJF35862.1 hypothetical protein L0M14_12735 [Paenibacillus sp. YPD9-1]
MAKEGGGFQYGKSQIKVPYGYEPPAQSRRGTLFIMETFEDWNEEDMAALMNWANQRNFARVVLYPQHEETLRRMSISSEAPYHARMKHLEELAKQSAWEVPLHIDSWEGKRKKYTPMDTSLNFLTDKYHGPYFLCISDRYANLFVTYSSFDQWIKKLRLVIMSRYHVPLNDKIAAYQDRLEVVDFQHASILED